MTRATLLHVLDRPTALGPVEVRELEQLAQAFPYCQTAHLLLAKAAHDQGTMLAGQRLRRAATYAADRTLLRRLIESAAPGEPTAAEAPVAEVPVAVAPAADAPATAPAVAAIAVMAEMAEAPAPVAPPAQPQAAPMAEAAPLPLAVATQMPVAELPAAAPVPEAALVPSQPVPTAVPASFPEAPAALLLAVEAPTEAPVPAPLAPDLPALVDQEGITIVAAEPVPESEIELVTEPVAAPIPVAVVAEPEPDLPAQAPAIRPPVEVGEARFEFGLAEPPPVAKPAYELPGLIDEWAAAAVTLGMGSREPQAPTLALAPTEVPATLTPTAFLGDETVGYGFGESSRMGFSLQLLNLLTANAGATDITAPAAPLPPTGAFFEPDPLLREHWAAHCPPVPVLPSSLDLINNFLRRQPRLTRPAMLPPATSVQADLSVRSTRAEPDLVSESLARILVRQGKTARAIEIYEKLMVKQPEKMAYFASQIQQLQPPA